MIDDETQLAEILDPADFYDETHRLMFTTEQKLIKKNGSGSFLDLCEELKGKVDQNVIINVLEIPTISTPTKAVVRRLKELRSQRELQEIGTEAQRIQPTEAPQKFLEISERFAGYLPKTEEVSREEIIAELEKKEDLLPTGFLQMDMILEGGLPPGSLCLIAARPGIGKSSLATNLAANFLKAGKKPCFFSLEMARKQVLTRILAAYHSKLAADIQKEAKVLMGDLEILPETHIGTNDCDTIKTITLSTTADVVIIDYLGLITSKGSENRFQQMEEISRSIKLLAIHTGKPIILLTQLNREIEKAKTPRPPMLADLWGGGEKDADLIT